MRLLPSLSFFAMSQDGNVEYKRHVLQATGARLRSLATQMSFRLDEGHGVCVYRIGVEDDGCHSQLSYGEMADSARLLEHLARTLNAVVLERKMIQNEVVSDKNSGGANEEANPVKSSSGEPVIVYEETVLGDANGNKRAIPVELQPKDAALQLRKELGHYTRAELKIQRVETHLLDPSPLALAELQQQPTPEAGKVGAKNGSNGHSSTTRVAGDDAASFENNKENGRQLSVGETLSSRNIRVAVVGNVDAGKSTLIGSLTTSCLDDGRGRCRTSIMKHRHEIESGRTSTATTHLMGFRSTGQPIAAKDQVRANKRKGEDEIAREAYRIITLMDLAGHEKYLKTTYVVIALSG